MTIAGKALIFSVAGALVGLILLVLPPRPTDERLQIIVDRSDGYVELYLTAPATALVNLFALPPQSLSGQDGTVNFERFQLGTTNIGDQLFDGVTSKAGGAEIEFEAMSVMVHPIDDKLPFDNAIDGVWAISVCITENPEAPFRLSQLQAYSGFIASTRHYAETISLSVPNLSKKTWNVLVRDHVDGALQQEYVASISDDGELTLPRKADLSLLDRFLARRMST